MQRILFLSVESFTNMLPSLIASGVTFEAMETDNGQIKIEFTGGY